MSLLDAIIPRTTFPEDETVIEGTITRFGMSIASEFRNVFAFRVQGRDEAFAFTLEAGHGKHRLGLVAPGDRIRASGHMRDATIKRCAIAIEAGQDRMEFGATLQVLD